MIFEMLKNIEDFPTVCFRYRQIPKSTTARPISREGQEERKEYLKEREERKKERKDERKKDR